MDNRQLGSIYNADGSKLQAESIWRDGSDR